MDNWLVVFTTSQRTGRIVQGLGQSPGFRVFAPKTLSSLGRIVWLFPTYIFVLLENATRRAQLWDFRGVRKIVELRRPDVERLNDLISRSESFHGHPNVIRPVGTSLNARYHKGQTVFIKNGPFKGHKATFDSMVSSDKGNVIINVFSREVGITVEEKHLSLFEF